MVLEDNWEHKGHLAFKTVGEYHFHANGFTGEWSLTHTEGGRTKGKVPPNGAFGAWGSGTTRAAEDAYDRVQSGDLVLESWNMVAGTPARAL